MKIEPLKDSKTFISKLLKPKGRKSFIFHVFTLFRETFTRETFRINFHKLKIMLNIYIYIFIYIYIYINI